MNHPWKGNVRELEHVLESAMILGEGDVISPPRSPGLPGDGDQSVGQQRRAPGRDPPLRAASTS